MSLVSVACLVFPFSLLWPTLLTCSGCASVTATAGWQHGSKHAEVWWQCPLSPWEQNQNKWPPFRINVTVCDGDYEECPQFTNCCSNGTQTLFANIFNWKKHRTSATLSKCARMEFVWNMADLFHSIHQIFHSIPIFSFHSIFHSIP